MLSENSRLVRSTAAHARRTRQARIGVPQRQLGSAARLRALAWADLGAFNHYVRVRYGIEIRDPLGSKRLVELSLQLGPEHFCRDGEARSLSINLLRGRVPDRVTGELRRGAQGSGWATSGKPALDEMKAELDRIETDPALAELFDVPQLRAKLSAGDQDEGGVVTAVCAARFARRVRERAAS